MVQRTAENWQAPKDLLAAFMRGEWTSGTYTRRGFYARVMVKLINFIVIILCTRKVYARFVETKLY